MDCKSAGDMSLVSNRVIERADLQSLNQRFAAYIQAVRSAQDIRCQKKYCVSQSTCNRDEQSKRLQYEQQIAELQAKIEEIVKEKLELALDRASYDSTLSEYKSRIVALNQSLYEKQNELQRLHGAVAAKDVELQEARSNATQLRLALDVARLEIEDLRKRLQESDRRLQLEISAKGQVQQQLSDLQREITIYQEKMSCMRCKLENSHQLILELEEKVRKAGQTDSSLVVMMKKVREASEAELRRFMEETEANCKLNIQEFELLRNADVQNLALAEKNARLQSQIDAQLTEMQTIEAKLADTVCQKQAIEMALAKEKSMFQAAVRNLEVKLKETQDSLLVKIQELCAARKANIPLRAEINALKCLIEEEEQRIIQQTVSSGNACTSTATTRCIPACGSLGKDCFTMFNNVRKDTLCPKVTEDDARHAAAQVSSVHQDYINSTSSATGNLKVLQIVDDGSSVTISNVSTTQEENLGGFMVQQIVGGQLVAVFRFPPRASLRAASSITVWSGKAVNGIHNPPHHYIWSKLDKWGTGPDCTTILCKPNGQAVAWMTSAPRVIKKSKKYKYTANMKQQTEETKKLLEDLRVKKQMNEDDSDVEDLISEDQWRPDPVIPPSSYSSKPTLYSNTGYNPRPPPCINRPKSSPPSSKTAVSSGLLPSRTGSSPLHLHQSRTTTTHQDLRPFVTSNRDLIKLTTQKTARSKYGFDYMAYPPKVTNYGGTV